jgi:lipopolysaccharide/colanic/teichoic acid biosynthesis glycosyltransferase
MAISDQIPRLSNFEATVKRTFDIFLSLVLLAIIWWVILLGWLLATIDTKSNGFFTQNRVGLNGRVFKICKIKTMRHNPDLTTTVTVSGDPRITRLGAFFRRTKIDELPQLWNVARGDMSFVGPRPDVPGFADLLGGEDRSILSVRPGITGPATLKYRDEESLLANQENPDEYNRDVIFPDKVAINKEYCRKWSLLKDLGYIWETMKG